MKKKTIANIVMVFIIFAIALSGVFYVGHIKGWFDKHDKNGAVLGELRGIITLERDGVAFTVSEDTVLRNADKIICQAGATAQIRIGEDYVTLGSGASVVIKESEITDFYMEISEGEVFVNADNTISLGFAGKKITFVDTVATLSVRSGAQSISVYYGQVEDAEKGQMLEWIGDEATVRECFIGSLNDFNIAQLRKVNETKELCFTNSDLDKLEFERLENMGNSDNDSENNNKEEPHNTSAENNDKEELHNTSDVNELSSNETEAPLTETTATYTEENSSGGEGTEQQASSGEEAATTEGISTVESTTEHAEITEEAPLTCTLTIRCDTILNNWDSLDPAKAPFVPDSGCILPTVTVEFTEGETVFDVLNRACATYGIQLEYSWTPMYNSYYIEGINNLYEFDCGSESGWMYKVNGWFPNYGCSSYTLTGGESIVWCYTCVGLGSDVGSSGW